MNLSIQLIYNLKNHSANLYSNYDYCTAEFDVEYVNVSKTQKSECKNNLI